ncbi:hypothetical protein FRC09_001894 [Ceratobasidium sp. 395]|nr:hypothetical protein FRC09_001894 [Ceratobasidium sp. 395]
MTLNARCSRWGESDETSWQWSIGVEGDIDTAMLKGVRSILCLVRVPLLGLSISLPLLRAYKNLPALFGVDSAIPKRVVKTLITQLVFTSCFLSTKHTYEAYLALTDLHLYPPNRDSKLNIDSGLHVLQQMRARVEDAGTHRATVAMLRAGVVFCTEGIVEDVGSE